MMMNVYKPLATGKIVLSSKLKYRRLFLAILNWYDVVSGSIIFLIVLLTIYPLLSISPLFGLWLLIFVAFTTLKSISDSCEHLYKFYKGAIRVCFPKQARTLLAQLATYRRKKVNSRTVAQHFHLFLSVSLICATTVLIITVYFASSVHHIVGETTIWLLFSPPVWFIARSANFKWIMSISVLTGVANTITSVVVGPITPWQFEALRVPAIQSLWLVFVCLLPVILLSYLAEREVGMNIALKVAERITCIRTTSMQSFANRAASVIAHKLGYNEVDIFLTTSPKGSDDCGKGLLLIGAATEAGRKLVQENYICSTSGIIARAAADKKYCIVNDTSRDSRKQYRHRENSQRPKAELAIPIMIGKELIGILDVKSEQRFAFSKDDVNLLRVITAHLAVATSNAQSLAHTQGLYNISRSINKRLLSHQELRPMLEEIVKEAHATLLADLVILYPYDPDTHVFGDPVIDGKLQTYAASAASINLNTHSSVLQAMRAEEAQFLVGSNTMTNYTVQPSTTFPEREGICATAILPLNLGAMHSVVLPNTVTNGTLGVMFVSYRKPHAFTNEYKDWCHVVAEIAALALQNAQLYARVIKQERTNMHREIYNGLVQDANITRILLENIVDIHSKKGIISEQKLLSALECSQSTVCQVNYLVESWRDVGTPYHLFDEISRYADIVHNTLNVACQCNTVGVDTAVPHNIQNEVYKITKEVVWNAVRHGHARDICIHLCANDARLQLIITDDGKGFDIQKLPNAHGLTHICDNVKHMGGQTKIMSELGFGTNVSVIIPFPTNIAEYT